MLLKNIMPQSAVRLMDVLGFTIILPSIQLKKNYDADFAVAACGLPLLEYEVNFYHRI